MQRRAFCGTVVWLLAAGGSALPSRSPAMRIRSIEPSDNAFAHACEVSAPARLLFISGQVPEDDQGQVPPDYPSQYRLAWANVERRLKAADMTFANLVKATIFLSDRSLIAQSTGLRRAILGEHCPAITIVITGIYDEAWLLEIEAIAAA